MNQKKRGKVNVMLDIETLGTDSDAFIFQIAAAKFDIKTGEVRDTFNMTQDISYVQSAKINPRTLLWWLETDSLLLKSLLAGDYKEMSPDLLKSFKDWIDYTQDTLMDDVLLWGNGVIFDNRIIREQMNQRGLGYPIAYNNDRDVRTILSLAAEKLHVSEREIKDRVKDDNLMKHDAIHDVAAQIKLVSYCHNVLVGNS